MIVRSKFGPQNTDFDALDYHVPPTLYIFQSEVESVEFGATTAPKTSN